MVNQPPRSGNKAGIAFLVVVLVLFGLIGVFALRTIDSASFANRPMPTATVTPLLTASLAIVNSENSSLAPNVSDLPVVTGEEVAPKLFSEGSIVEGQGEFELETASSEKPATQANEVIFVLTPSPTVQQVSQVNPVQQVPTPTSAAVAQAAAPVVAGKTASWSMTWFKGADLDRGDGTTFRSDVENLWPDFWLIEPAKWPTPPNIPNSLESRFVVKQGQFGPEVPDGMEIPQGEANYCQVIQGELCTNPIAAEHYMLYTGDGEIGGVWKSVPDMGNTLMIVNVGRVTARFDGAFWQGWRVTGRYWNGDTLPIGVTSMIAHTANVMHNYNSPLNPNSIANAGANCSVPEACNKVHHTVIFVSGNELLLRLDAETVR